MSFYIKQLFSYQTLHRNYFLRKTRKKFRGKFAPNKYLKSIFFEFYGTYYPELFEVYKSTHVSLRALFGFSDSTPSSLLFERALSGVVHESASCWYQRYGAGYFFLRHYKSNRVFSNFSAVGHVSAFFTTLGGGLTGHVTQITKNGNLLAAAASGSSSFWTEIELKDCFSYGANTSLTDSVAQLSGSQHFFKLASSVDSLALHFKVACMESAVGRRGLFLFSTFESHANIIERFRTFFYLDLFKVNVGFFIQYISRSLKMFFCKIWTFPTMFASKRVQRQVWCKFYLYARKHISRELIQSRPSFGVLDGLLLSAAIGYRKHKACNLSIFANGLSLLVRRGNLAASSLLFFPISASSYHDPIARYFRSEKPPLPVKRGPFTFRNSSQPSNINVVEDTIGMYYRAKEWVSYLDKFFFLFPNFFIRRAGVVKSKYFVLISRLFFNMIPSGVILQLRNFNCLSFNKFKFFQGEISKRYVSALNAVLPLWNVWGLCTMAAGELAQNNLYGLRIVAHIYSGYPGVYQPALVNTILRAGCSRPIPLRIHRWKFDGGRLFIRRVHLLSRIREIIHLQDLSRPFLPISEVPSRSWLFFFISTNASSANTNFSINYGLPLTVFYSFLMNFFLAEGTYSKINNLTKKVFFTNEQFSFRARGASLAESDNIFVRKFLRILTRNAPLGWDDYSVAFAERFLKKKLQRYNDFFALRLRKYGVFENGYVDLNYIFGNEQFIRTGFSKKLKRQLFLFPYFEKTNSTSTSLHVGATDIFRHVQHLGIPGHVQFFMFYRPTVNALLSGIDQLSVSPNAPLNGVTALTNPFFNNLSQQLLNYDISIKRVLEPAVVANYPVTPPYLFFFSTTRYAANLPLNFFDLDFIDNNFFYQNVGRVTLFSSFLQPRDFRLRVFKIPTKLQINKYTSGYFNKISARRRSKKFNVQRLQILIPMEVKFLENFIACELTRI